MYVYAVITFAAAVLDSYNLFVSHVFTDNLEILFNKFSTAISYCVQYRHGLCTACCCYMGI